MKKDKVYFSLYSSSHPIPAVEIGNTLIFGGFWRRAVSKIYTNGNDIILYVREDPEKIEIRGPTRSDITIKVS